MNTVHSSYAITKSNWNEGYIKKLGECYFLVEVNWGIIRSIIIEHPIQTRQSLDTEIEELNKRRLYD